MNRAIIFRIVGLGFLVFAAVSIYRGEFEMARSGGAVVTRAHDPEAFWRVVVIQIGIGGALLYLSRSASGGLWSRSAPSRPSGRGELFTLSQSSQDRPSLPNYNPALCGKLVKGAACICVGLIIAELLVLLFVHPSDERCPGWIFHPHQRSAVSLWVLAGLFTVLPTIWICNVALRWDQHYARKMYDSIAAGPPEQLLIDANSLALMVMAGWCLFCAIPLFMMLGHCTAISAYLDALHV